MSALMQTLATAWAERSAREQLLLAVLGGILLILGGWYLVAKPVFEFRNEARSAYVESVERYRELSVGIARYQALSADLMSGETSDNRPLRTLVAEQAAMMELPLSRMVPDENGRLNVWTENANAQTLMDWLAELERQHGIVAVRANIDREGEGLARAQIVLERGRS